MRSGIIVLMLVVLFVITGTSQVPQAFKYQAVLRDINGDIIQNKDITIQVSILQGSSDGEVVYQEIHKTTTNGFGLINLNIGQGSAVKRQLSTVNWTDGPHYISIALDHEDGNNFIPYGTAQLLSVPYALYAEKAGDDENNRMNTWGIWSQDVYTGTGGSFPAGNVGIGTRITYARLSVMNNTGYTSAFRRISDNPGNALFLLQKARGNEFTPSSVEVGDHLGQIRFEGYQNGDFLTGSFIRSSVEALGEKHITGNLKFATGSTDAIIERMRITGNGNIGIGNTNPIAILDVTGNLRINNGTQGYNKILVSDINGISHWEEAGNLFTIHNGLTRSGNIIEWGGPLIKPTSIDLDGNNLGFLGQGNIGIGTTFANYKLDVDGDVHASGTITSGNSIIIDGNAGTITETTGLVSFSDNTVTTNGEIGIGTSYPDPTALLELSSDSRGFLPSRMNDAQRDAINNPATGLTIYNTQDTALQIYNGEYWQSLVFESCAPEAPDSIMGPERPGCNTVGVTYSIDPVLHAFDYYWTVPEGATITDGQGTTSITVTFGDTSGVVKVLAENSCGQSPFQELGVTLEIPSAPKTIHGSDKPGCSADGVVFSIDSIPYTNTYNWQVPSDANIVAGQGTRSITVDFGNVSDTIKVNAENSCGASQDAMKYIDLRPDKPHAVHGYGFNHGHTIQSYDIDEVLNATQYNWTVPGDAIITDGQGTTQITLEFGEECGYVSAQAENSCGQSAFSRIYATLSTTSTPLIYGDTTYKTVRICNRIWMAENMKHPVSAGSYSHSKEYSAEYGLFYTFDTAMVICPEGWRLPSVDDWQSLIHQYANSNVAWSLREPGTAHWQVAHGDNKSGFTAFGAGYAWGGIGYFGLVNSTQEAQFWSSNIHGNTTDAYGMKYWSYDLYNTNVRTSMHALSVRCVKDVTPPSE